jgi:hypothetical protein
MKLITDNTSHDEDVDGSLIFLFEGYVYYIGHLDGDPGWFSRQTLDDYNNHREKWEAVTGWLPENLTRFKLLG